MLQLTKSRVYGIHFKAPVASACLSLQRFLFFTFCLILCDLSGMAAYFFRWQAAYFPERIFYLLSLALLINFSLNRSTEEKESLLYSK